MLCGEVSSRPFKAPSLPKITSFILSAWDINRIKAETPASEKLAEKKASDSQSQYTKHITFTSYKGQGFRTLLIKHNKDDECWDYSPVHVYKLTFLFICIIGKDNEFINHSML